MFRIIFCMSSVTALKCARLLTHLFSDTTASAFESCTLLLILDAWIYGRHGSMMTLFTFQPQGKWTHMGENKP